MACGLIELCAAAHGTGLVLGDFNPGNLLVMPDEGFRLIDLESVALPGERVHRRFTMAYAAPEQISAPHFGPAPGQAVDWYGLGATVFHLLTGTAPIFPADVPSRRRFDQRVADRVCAMAADNAALAFLAPVICGLMRAEPERRWSVSEAGDFLRDGASQGDPGARATGRAHQPDLDEIVRDGLAYTAGDGT